jgi:peptidoglycan/LPS O-acetylase OafA/YrhL
MRLFISGLLVAGYLVAGLFFLRFWRQSRDRLFAFFTAAFWLLALQRGALAAVGLDAPGSTWLYGLRLLAFLLILAAIVDKNRPARDPAA